MTDDPKKHLKTNLDNLVDGLREYHDKDAAQSVSDFLQLAQENQSRYNELQTEFRGFDKQLNADMAKVQEFRGLVDCQKEVTGRLESLEGQVQYLEAFVDELEEYQSEILIKTKVSQHRKSRIR